MMEYYSSSSLLVVHPNRNCEQNVTPDVTLATYRNFLKKHGTIDIEPNSNFIFLQLL